MLRRVPMLRRVKEFVVDRLGVSRVAEAAHEALDRTDRQAALMEQLDQWRRITLHTDVVAAAAPMAGPLISIVMATRDRRDLMLHAIASVRSQSHTAWELLVIDDGSTDGSADAAEHLGDERIRVIRAAGGGAGSARNIGVRAATGDWVAFLDDDNVMAPHWLKAIALYASEGAARVVYGAQVREREADDAEGGGVLREPFHLFVEPFDLQRLRQTNYIDLGVLAVRRGAPELWFDVGLRRFIDWEMIVRLAASEMVQPLPVWSSTYSTRVAGRISQLGTIAAGDAFALRLADPADEVGTVGRTPHTQQP